MGAEQHIRALQDDLARLDAELAIQREGLRDWRESNGSNPNQKARQRARAEEQHGTR